MTQVILNKLTNYNGETLNPGETINVDERTAKRWAFSGLAHYSEDFEIQPIKFEPLMDCKPTSIIILTVTNADILKRCVNSIIKNTNNYELILIGNNPDDRVKDYISGLNDINAKVIINSENKGYPYGCNQGIKLATHDYICFLNDDTVVSKNWLAKLQKTFDIKNDCGIASPTTCYSNGIQCDWNIAPRRFEMTDDNISSYASNLKEDYIQTIIYGFCMLTKKSILDKVGGFDYKLYGVGNSEETDLQWRLEQVGYKSYWAKQSYVHHLTHSTFDALKINPYSLCVKNRALFEDKKKAYNLDNTIDLYIKNDVKLPKVTKITAVKTDAIDVIIPVLDRQNETIQTLNSLFENNDNINVIIVDNGSDNYDYVKGYSNIKLVKNKTNIGVIKAINKGLKLAKSKYVVVMHNDVIVNTYGWISKAVKFMEANKDVGMVGMAGWTELNSHGNYLTKNLITAIDKYNQKPKGFAEVAALDGCCNVIRKEFNYDIDYGLMHFYDLDISMKYKAAGYKLFVMNASVIHLAENRSISTITNDKYKSITNKDDVSYYRERNDIFIKKWGSKLPTTLEPIPIKLITWNRLEYTKKTIASVLANTDYPFKLWIFDNNSTDGTVDYLQSLKDDRIEINYSDKNLGLVPPFNIFLEKFKNNKYICQLDNDIIVPKGWLGKFKAVMDNLPIFSLSADHYLGIPYRIKTNEEFYNHLETIDFEGDKLYLFPHAGMGNMVRREWLDKPVQVIDGNLGGWVRYQCDKWQYENRTCAFHGGVWIDLQDMEATNTPRYDYPEYRGKTNVMRSGDKNSSGFGTKDLDINELEGIRKQVREKWLTQLS